MDGFGRFTAALTLYLDFRDPSASQLEIDTLLGGLQQLVAQGVVEPESVMVATAAVLGQEAAAWSSEPGYRRTMRAHYEAVRLAATWLQTQFPPGTHLDNLAAIIARLYDDHFS